MNVLEEAHFLLQKAQDNRDKPIGWCVPTDAWYLLVAASSQYLFVEHDNVSAKTTLYGLPVRVSNKYTALALICSDSP